MDLSVSYYNSKPQVRASLARLRDLIVAIPAREVPELVLQLSQLALASGNSKARAVRDRLDVDELERLLVEEFGVSRKTIYRLLKSRAR